MSFRTFILGLVASFGVAWLAVVVIPFVKMRNRAPVVLNEETDGANGIFFPKRTGRIADGAQVYAENGCYLCHTQLIRPTYAGNDIYRSDWGGVESDADRGDTRRETMPEDFFGEKFAQIGVVRMGPDLSNLGHRVETSYAKSGSAAGWLYAFLRDPRSDPARYYSHCPGFPFLFEKKKIMGNPANDALSVDLKHGTEVVPTSDGKALVSYLLSLKKDQPVPAALNFAPAKPKG